jgi:hypothetical protein
VEKLARYLDKEKKIGVKLIVSAHLLKRISPVASTGDISLSNNNQDCREYLTWLLICLFPPYPLHLDVFSAQE